MASCGTFDLDGSRKANAGHSVSAATLELARETLNRWESRLGQTDWYKDDAAAKKRFLSNWTSLDSRKAIELEKAYSDYRLSLMLMRRLAANKQWDDVVEVSSRQPKGAQQVQVFWSRVAEAAVADNELRILELAGQQVEANATFESGSIGAPKIPTLELSGARFFVAASRLELYRGLPNDQKRVQTAIRELWQAAGDFSPLRTGFISSNHYESGPQYAALESWNESETKLNWINPASSKGLGAQIRPFIWKNIYWPTRLKVPSLELELVNAWYLRQLELDRRDVALSYLALAEGSSLHRARMLAIAVPYLRAEAKQTAIDLALKWLHESPPAAAPKVPVDDNDTVWLKIETQAEIAATLKQLGDDQAGKELALDAVRDFALVATTKHFGYDAFSAAYRAAAMNGLSRDDLPKTVIDISKRFLGFHNNRTVDAYPLHTRGIRRITDLSGIKLQPTPYRYPEHKKYYDLIAAKKWPETVKEIDRLAKGNLAWQTSWPTTGAKSVQDLGLEKTLEWTKGIKNEEARFDVEMGAIQEALRPIYKSLPQYRDSNTPSTIAPTIQFPTRGC